MTIHLHRDYNNAFCGLDASFIPMTYVPEEADCVGCLEAKEEYDKEAAKAEAKHAHVVAEEAALRLEEEIEQVRTYAEAQLDKAAFEEKQAREAAEAEIAAAKRAEAKEEFNRATEVDASVEKVLDAG